MIEIDPKKVAVREAALGRYRAVTRHPTLPWVTLILDTFDRKRILPSLTDMANKRLERENHDRNADADT